MGFGGEGVAEKGVGCGGARWGGGLGVGRRGCSWDGEKDKDEEKEQKVVVGRHGLRVGGGGMFLADGAEACSFFETMNSETVPRIDGVVETILYVDDLARAVAFYRDVMGLRAMTGDGERFQAFDVRAGQVLLLFKRGGTLEPVPAPVGMIPPHDGSGPLHVGFGVAVAAYPKWRDRLVSCGVAIESETEWERGGRSLYFRDPDGHLVELITPGIWANY